MKNIFKSKKTRKSLIGGALAIISLFSFNFSPISVMVNKFSHAAVYEATETKITENTSSNQIQATELPANLKDYFKGSSNELNLSDYYESKFEELLIEKVEAYFKSRDGESVKVKKNNAVETEEFNYAASLSSHATLKDYFETTNASAQEFVMRFVNTILLYNGVDNNGNYVYPSIDVDAKQFKKLSAFYNDFANFIRTETNSVSGNDGISNETTDFYKDSVSYKLAKEKLDGIIKETIAIVSYDGSDDNKVAAIIVNDAPASSEYKYGSTYEVSQKPYLNIGTKATFDKTKPFDFIKQGSDWHKLSTFPYQTNTNGSLVVYVKTNGEISSSEQSTLDFLGYKTVTSDEIATDHAAGYNTYSPVPYSQTEKHYFEYLYNELVNGNKINETISFDSFVNLFVKTSGNVTESVLYVKYNSASYKNNIYVASNADYQTLAEKQYTYLSFVKVADIASSAADYVKISDTTLDQAYSINSVSGVTLYFKNEIIPYTKEKVVYLKDGSDNFIFETEEKLEIEFEKVSNNNKIYVLDEEQNASENKIYQSLGYTVITAPTIEYKEIEESDDNYNKNFKLYYKYADANKVFAKNLLTLTTGTTATAKNAVYVLTSSVESDLTNICKINSYIPLSKDELAAGGFTKVNKADPIFSDKYELYYKYDESVYSKTVNKIFEYTANATSEFNAFYKTDKDYNLDDYVKIEKGDENYKQGFDLYYKKSTKTETTEIKQNTTYSFTTKSSSGIKFTKNSYYAITFYVNTTGAGITASLELDDSTELLSDAKITNIQTNGKWVKYYMFVATNTLTDSSAKIVLSLGTTDGISDDENATLTGSVLFDEVKIFKINETDFAKKTINNEAVFVEDGGKQVDNATNKNEVLSNFEFNAKTTYFGNNAVSNWNQIFDIDTIDGSILSNVQAEGGALSKFYLSNSTDSATSNFDTANANDLWRYYIGRDVSGKNNSELEAAYKKAYADLKANISIVSEADAKPASTAEPTATVEETEDNDKPKIDPIIDSTFKANNKILKIENTSASMSLGVVSRPFTLKAAESYKISLWIYAPKKGATATVKLISNLLTAQQNEFGKELFAGASDIDAFIDEDEDSGVANEYRWLPVEIYVQGNILKDQNCNLVLLADENSTVYFDNITIEKITTDAYTNASTSSARVYKLSLTDSTTALTKLITNGFFNDSTISDLDEESHLPRVASNWTTTTDAAQDYVTAGVISSKNTKFIEEFNGNVPINNTLATNMYAISVDDGKLANHKIYSKSFSLTAGLIYKVTFEYYISNGNFTGDVVANLYNDSYKAENKISSIRATSLTAGSWTSVTYYIATGSNSAKPVLEIGVEDAAGTIFFRNVYATTISQTLDEVRSANATIQGSNLVLKNDHINIVDYSKNAFTLNKDADDEGNILSNEYKTNSTNSMDATTGSAEVIVSELFSETKTTEKTVTINETKYYIYDNGGSLELYKYSKYDGTTLADNEKLTEINKKPFEIRDGKVIVGSGNNETEYEIEEKVVSKFTYSYDDATVGKTTIAGTELANSNSQNVLVLANANETDYTEVESNYKLSLSSSSYYALKFYVKTSDFEKENFGLSISAKATNLDINWNANLINTNGDEISALHKDANGFVCYQLLINTKKSSYSDLIVKFMLGDISNTGKGYAIISSVELVKLGSEDEFDHYKSIFASDDDTSIVKVTSGSDNISNTAPKTSSEVTWSTFFYIFSSLLLFVVLVMAMVAVFIKKHPIKHNKVKIVNENFDTENAAKNKNEVVKDNDTKTEGGIE